ncbi:MAG: hypothetical protein ACI9MC_001170 [Kiritimatiellia bacterium]|jgi:hypothetical protein
MTSVFERLLVAVAALVLAACAGEESPSDSTDLPEVGWRSALYPSDWTPSLTDRDGRFLHDVSYAGYHRSEQPLPTIDGPVFLVSDFGADATGAEDSTAAIQSTIDAASEHGGVVLLDVGLYRVDGLLEVRADGVVIRGAGAERTQVAFTRSEGMTGKAHLTFRGAITMGEHLLLSSDAVNRSVEVGLQTTGSLSVGDDIVLGWTITDDFIDEHGMTGTWKAFNGTWRPFFAREVVSVDGSLGVDVPLRYDAKRRDQASVRRVTGYLSEVGVEDLSVSTEAPWHSAWDNSRSHAVGFIGVKDSWVRGVGSFDSPFVDDLRHRHLQSGGVLILDSKRMTVADSVLQLAQNRGGGGNGYLFEISRSGDILVRDCEGHGGRHNFIQNWDFGSNGLVFLRTVSTGGKAFSGVSSNIGTVGLSEFHHSLAMANLIDSSVADDGWGALNRQDWSSGAGHSATQTVFWNLRGQGKVRSFQYGHGYVIGTSEIDVQTDLLAPDPFENSEHSEPQDWTEGVDEAQTLVPQSLFEDQLARRLAR